MLIAASLIVLCAAILDALLLPAMGRALIVESGAGQSDAVLVVGGDHRLRIASELVQSGRAKQVWLIETAPDYLVVNGLAPPLEHAAIAALVANGIEPSSIRVIPVSNSNEPADLARAVEPLLREKTGSLLILCDQFEGRHMQLVFERVLAATATHLGVYGAPPDGVSAKDWWRTRRGLKHVFGKSCNLLFTLVAGTGARPATRPVSAETIEQDLRRRFGEIRCDDL